MILAILTNIHVVCAIASIFFTMALIFSFLNIVLDNKPWDEATKSFPNKFLRIITICLAMSLVGFCVTPSTSDVIIHKLRG